MTARPHTTTLLRARATAAGTAALAVIGLVVALLATPIPAGAQLEGILPGTTTTTTGDSGGGGGGSLITPISPTTTTTTTTTTAPPPQQSPPPAEQPPPPPPPGDPPPPGGTPPPEDETGDDRVGSLLETAPDPAWDAGFPPHLRARTDSVRRSGPRSTRPLLDALTPLVELGMTETEAALAGFGRFPVAGHARYIHDWWFPRFGPGWRLHQGIDIFAPRGTPVRAPVDGTVRTSMGGLGGLAVYVDQPDGTYYYLSHLDRFAEGLGPGQAVRAGDVVGFVGTTGNAATTPPHVHIQVHPYGGAPIDPKPILDRFLDDAIARAPELVDAHERAQAARAVSQEDGAGVAEPAAFVIPSETRNAALHWTTAQNPLTIPAHLAVRFAEEVAAGIDWPAREEQRRQHEMARQMADEYARSILTPLVPSGLAAVSP